MLRNKQPTGHPQVPPAKPPQYHFPILDYTDLQRCIAELLKKDIDEKSLRNPTKFAVDPIYAWFVDRFFFAAVAPKRKMSDEESDVFMYPEAHTHTLPRTYYLHALRLLMLRSGVSDFTFKDLIHPEPSKVRKNLSALINLLKYSLPIQDRFDRLHLELQAAKREHAAKEDLKQALIDELSATKANADNTTDKINALELASSHLLLEIDEIDRTQTFLRQKIDAQRKMLSDISDTLAVKRLDVIKKRGLRSEIEAKIIKSPEIIIDEKRRAEDDLVREKKLVMDKEREKAELDQYISRCDLLLGDLDSQNSLLKQLTAYHTEYIAKDRQLQALNDEVRRLGTDAKRSAEKVAGLGAALGTEQDKHDAALAEHKAAAKELDSQIVLKLESLERLRHQERDFFNLKTGFDQKLVLADAHHQLELKKLTATMNEIISKFEHFSLELTSLLSSNLAP